MTQKDLLPEEKHFQHEQQMLSNLNNKFITLRLALIEALQIKSKDLEQLLSIKMDDNYSTFPAKMASVYGESYTCANVTLKVKKIVNEMAELTKLINIFEPFKSSYHTLNKELTNTKNILNLSNKELEETKKELENLKNYIKCMPHGLFYEDGKK